ncbi:hypothetical protein HII12_001302 [Brettanomyces bruxellensis]|uniref:DUF3533 domain-containing protein n=1 Tax=Dekkera bruxellensis TaxID=5007 RepID=A0A8H6BNX3_DEKBR|nr:hypothetical protein HII12_001302 [Brettanomyces bruxellensis]
MNSKIEKEDAELSSGMTGSDSDIERYSAHERVASSRNDLLRSVTQYTELSMSNGVAEAREEISKTKGGIPERKTSTFLSKDGTTIRKTFAKQYFPIILILCTYLLAVFSIYWGAMYKRSTRLVNLKVLVSVENDRSGVITNSLLTAIKIPEIREMSGWTVRNYMSEEEIKKLVYEQKYWGAIYVSSPDISSEFMSGFHGNTSATNLTAVKGYIETGNDIMGVPNYVKPALLALDSAYTEIMKSKVYPSIIANLSSTEFSDLQKSSALTNFPDIEITDGNPLTNYILMAPMQVGLIYIIILCLFQILWFIKLNGDLAPLLKPVHYIIYRLVISQCNYLILSLFYATLNRAFQVDMQKAWKGGFGVFWMFSFLIIYWYYFNGNTSSLDWLFGFLFFIILNVSATFAPIQVCPKIFRIAYALPIRNGYDLMKVVLMNTYKGYVGRCVGVLIAWIVLNNILFPFALIFLPTCLKKKIKKQAAAKLAMEEESKINTQ